MAKAKKTGNAKMKPIEQYDRQGKRRLNNPAVGLSPGATDKQSGKNLSHG